MIRRVWLQALGHPIEFRTLADNLLGLRIIDQKSGVSG